MEKFICTSCKASLKPAHARVEFITCIYCRSTNKNPNFKEIINQTVQFQQNMRQQPSQHSQSARNSGGSQDTEFLMSFLMSLFAFGQGRRRRRSFRRRRRRGMGCSSIIILILLVLIAWLFRAEILEIIFELMG